MIDAYDEEAIGCASWTSSFFLALASCGRKTQIERDEQAHIDGLDHHVVWDVDDRHLHGVTSTFSCSYDSWEESVFDGEDC